MGVCQTVGGAATSGEGMTGDQVAFAIREGISILGANEKKKAEEEEEEEEGSPQSKVGKQRGDDGDDIKRELPSAEAYKEVRTASIKYVRSAEGKVGDDDGPGETTIEVTSYAPEVFRYLRQLEGTSDAQCTQEWDLPESMCNMDLGSGKSMALFLKSKNQDFMAKTIAETEVNVLLDVLQKYTEHLTTNQHSLLMRFTMLYKVEIKETNITGFILCFGDLFSTCPRINELWDIKGRVPKPGKYLHFPKRDSSGTYHEDASTDGCAGRGDGPSFEEVNAGTDNGTSATSHHHLRRGSTIAGVDEGHSGNAVDEPQSPTSKKLAVRKDKDLSRLFWVPESQRVALVEQLHADYKILADSGLMDYSILIGVKYNALEEEEAAAASPTAADAGGGPTASTLRRRKVVGESVGGEQQVRPPNGRGSAAQHKSRCTYHSGVTSIGGSETYYIGVIDMLTIYNIKKKTANFFKTFLWAPETISTIPPADYVARLDGFTDLIFPPLKKPEAV